VYLQPIEDETRSPATIKQYRVNLRPLSEEFGRQRLSSLTRNQVKAHLINGDWSEGTKHGKYQTAATFTAWCRDKGYIQSDPLAIGRNPFAQAVREAYMTREQFDKLLAATNREDFKLFMRALFFSGCRPGELMRLNVGHMHAKLCLATFLPREHKTGAKTGKRRKIRFPESVMADIRTRTVGRGDDEPMILNRKGRRWRSSLLHQIFRKAASKAGLPREIVPYCARHSFATEGIESGESTALLAQAMGHSGDQTIQNHYLHATNRAINGILERRADCKKSSKQEMKEEIASLSARLSELTAKVLDSDERPDPS
jgi:integrase